MTDAKRGATQLLEKEDRLDLLRAAVLEGYADAERGDTFPYSSELMEQLRQEALADARAGKPIPDEVRP